MAPNISTVVHWFRRDLRVTDNPALHAAAATGHPVVPVYILSDWTDRHLWTGSKRQEFLCASLAALAETLGDLGGQLIVRQGRAVEELRTLLKQTKATGLYYNEDPDPFGKAVEKEVQKLCLELGIECRAFHDISLHRADEILTQQGQPYRVFTPYSRNWFSQAKASPLPALKSLATPSGVKSLPLPTLATWKLKPEGEILTGGERAAYDRLKRSIQLKISSYKKTRDLPAMDGTSRLSQDLRFGLLSIRTVYAEACQAMTRATATETASIETFLKELAWREFYFAILHHYPHVLEQEFNADWRGLPWDEPGTKFEAWKAGRTGFPIVDAGMRQLTATGFMHNRVRMITAMFLTKDLHIDWRLGESWFMQNLVDGEIASNNGGWQWSAGTGADAAPYFRIQNPWSQTKRYDPKGDYIRQWVPELKEVPAPLLMAPPKEDQPIASGYPLPIVDHARERLRTLAIFKKHRTAKR